VEKQQIVENFEFFKSRYYELLKKHGEKLETEIWFTIVEKKIHGPFESASEAINVMAEKGYNENDYLLQIMTGDPSDLMDCHSRATEHSVIK